MTTSANIIARIAAFLFILAAVFGTTAYAQDFPCNCKILKIAVTEKVACPVTICVQLFPDGRIKCETVNPGNSIDVPCSLHALGVQLCDGNISWVIRDGKPELGLCKAVGQIGPKCCARICRAVDEKTGCQMFSIQPALCLSNCDY